jgi:hypothetical protein
MNTVLQDTFMRKYGKTHRGSRNWTPQLLSTRHIYHAWESTNASSVGVNERGVGIKLFGKIIMWKNGCCSGWGGWESFWHRSVSCSSFYLETCRASGSRFFSISPVVVGAVYVYVYSMCNRSNRWESLERGKRSS